MWSASVASAASPVINVFLVGGQSNADGRASLTGLPASLSAPQSDVPFYYAVSNSGSSAIRTSGFTTLRPGLSNTGQFGPEVTFGRSMADYYEARGGSVALIKYANGGTNLATDWKAGGTSGTTGDGAIYQNFQTSVTNGLAALRAANPQATLNITGMIWMQGESDANANSAAYQANLTAFIKDVRLTYGANLPFLIGELSVNQTGTNSNAGGTTADRNAVRAAQVAVANATAFTRIVNTDSFGLNSDNLHFDTSAQQDLGDSFAMQMQSIVAPEPSTLALVAIPLALGGLRRKRRRRAMAGLAPVVGLCLLASATTARAAELSVVVDRPAAADGVSLAGADVVVDANAAAVVHHAADLLAGDLSRVTGRPGHALRSDAANAKGTILVGTLGDGGPADALAQAGKVDVTGVRGQWETFAWQVVDHPMPGVPRALVILGGDRRGTAYGCTELSQAAGVSPWNWWADVPVAQHKELSVSPGRHVDGPPGVKYRGIFLNDEDWGLQPWASKTFDPQLGNLGPKTYGKLFELMLRLRLNYLWPAMHHGSAEFGSIPGNAETADQWAVVMGASHCEPMLRNNVYWKKADGPWRYDVNRDNILRYWAESVDQRGQFEAVWTVGIRGIHDTPMDGPPGVPARVKMVEGIFADQQNLLKKATGTFGPPATCFVPYKEVLPLYDAGMKVPDEATLVWPDDNFGYIRHLPNAAERKRSGGNGVYYHLSYLGPPQSYLWLESASPGLIWEELHKAWANDAGRLWVINVGDLKPAESAVDFYARLAWSPDRWGADAQGKFLREFYASNFGPSVAGPLADLASAYYRLAAVRRPEQFQYEWMNGLSQREQDGLMQRYADLAKQEAAVAKLIPPSHADAYFELVGYTARMLAASGQLHLHDEAAQRSGHEADLAAAKQLWAYIQSETAHYDQQVAGGKWHRMMSDTPHECSWPIDVGGTHRPRPVPATPVADRGGVVVAAGDMTGHSDVGSVGWRQVDGLGHSGKSMTVVPPVPFGEVGPSVDYTFDLSAPADASAVRLSLLPTMRVDPAGHLRVEVSLDGASPATYDVPGGEASDERSGPRRNGVMVNRVELPLNSATLTPGRHTVRVTAVDPGVALDEVELPAGAKVAR